MRQITVKDIGRLDQLGPAEETRFWKAFEHALANDDGAAAKAHLTAGRPIIYCEDCFPDAMIRKWPDGRRELIKVDHAGQDVVIRLLPDAV